MSRAENDRLFAELIEARSSGNRARELRVKNAIVVGNLGLVRSVAARFAGRSGSLTLEDLTQEGSIGLLRAIELFDPSRGFAFSTYALWWVRSALGRALANEGGTIRIPTHAAERAAPIRRAETRHYCQHGHAPTDAELSTATGQSLRAVRAVRAAPSEPSSLDAPLPEGSGALVDALPGDAPTPLDLCIARQDAERARALLASLPPKLRHVVAERFGEGELTLQEIGSPMGLSRERVRQIERDALEQLRKHISAHP